MSPGISYWIVAWSMMGLAFIAAFTAIMLSAHFLDRNTQPVDSEDT